MIVKNLWRHKARTLLTLAGISVGVAVVVLLFAMADGLVGQFTAMLEQSGSDITLIQAGVSDSSFSAIDESIGEDIAQVDGITHVSGVQMNVTRVGDRPTFLVFGRDPASFGMEHYRLVEGRGLSADDELLVGSRAAGLLEVGAGDTLSFAERTFRIVGVYETGVSYEDSGSLITLAAAQDLFRRPAQVTFYEVKLEVAALERAGQIAAEIEARFPQVEAYQTAEFAENLPDIQVFRALASGISLIGIVVGGLGAMNTMLMSVFERTREIGVLRALGWRRRQVLGMILGESLVLSLLAAVIGLGLGLLLLQAIVASPGVGEAIAGNLSGRSVLIAFAIAFGLGTLGGLYPAWRAAGLSPIEALRYE